jgi:adenosine deaminase
MRTRVAFSNCIVRYRAIKMDQKQFVKSLHKAELHHHLAGSIRNSTLLELVQASSKDCSGLPESEIHDTTLFLYRQSLAHRSLADCFKIFGMIHKYVHNSQQINRIVREMLEDASRDGVRYLEMRSTPRSLSDHVYASGQKTTNIIRVPPSCRVNGMILSETDFTDVHIQEQIDSALSHYVEVVVAALCSHAKTEPGLVARLILSVNRTEDISKAEAVMAVALAWKQVHIESRVFDSKTNVVRIMYSPVVVGIEVSGDPTRGDLCPLLNALTSHLGAADKRLLPVSVHAGEVMNVAETQMVLQWQPDRLGHMCVLSHVSKDQMLRQRIPLEVCPTSNTLTLHLTNLSDHPLLGALLQHHYPIAICTDDAGVFDVTLSQEILQLQATFGLTNEVVGEITLEAFSMAFCGWNEDNEGREIMLILKEEARRALHSSLGTPQTDVTDVFLKDVNRKMPSNSLIAK